MALRIAREVIEPALKVTVSKKGVAASKTAMLDPQLARGVSWSQNWTLLPPHCSTTFFPTVWGEKTQLSRLGVADKGAVLITYNEPDQQAQANMDPKMAARRWGDVMKAAKSKGYLLASPSPIGKDSTWLDDFFKETDRLYGSRLANVDLINVHYYSRDVRSIEDRLNVLQQQYGKKVIISELGFVNHGFVDVASQKILMKEVVPVLDGHPNVYGYAWYNGGKTANPPNELTRDGKLTPLGRLYTSL